MSKLSKLLMAIASIILIGFVGKAFILDEAVKGYLVTFFLSDRDWRYYVYLLMR